VSLGGLELHLGVRELAAIVLALVIILDVAVVRTVALPAPHSPEAPMSDTPNARVPFMKAAQFVLIGLLVGLLAGSGLAGWAWWQGQAQLTELQTERDDLQEQLQTQGQVHKDELAKRDQRIARLEARADIARALVQLDQRNFGTVNERLKDASDHLEGDADAASLQMAITNVSVTASEDLAGPREQLLALSKQADELVAR